MQDLKEALTPDPVILETHTQYVVKTCVRLGFGPGNICNMNALHMRPLC